MACRREEAAAASIAGTPCICICACICSCICTCIPICISICACIRGGRSMACRREEAAAASIAAAAARSPTPAIRTPAHQSQAVFPGGKYFFAKKKKVLFVERKQFSSLENFPVEKSPTPSIFLPHGSNFSTCDTFFLEYNTFVAEYTFLCTKYFFIKIDYFASLQIIIPCDIRVRGTKSLK